MSRKQNRINKISKTFEHANLPKTDARRTLIDEIVNSDNFINQLAKQGCDRIGAIGVLKFVEQQFIRDATLATMKTIWTETLEESNMNVGDLQMITEYLLHPGQARLVEARNLFITKSNPVDIFGRIVAEPLLSPKAKGIIEVAVAKGAANQIANCSNRVFSSANKGAQFTVFNRDCVDRKMN